MKARGMYVSRVQTNRQINENAKYVVIDADLPIPLSHYVCGDVLIKTVLFFAAHVLAVDGHYFVDSLVLSPLIVSKAYISIIFMAEGNVLMPALKVVSEIVGLTFDNTMRLREISNGSVVQAIGLIGRRQ